MEIFDKSERPNQQRKDTYYMCVNFDQPKFKVYERNILFIIIEYYWNKSIMDYSACNL